MTLYFRETADKMIVSIGEAKVVDESRIQEIITSLAEICERAAGASKRLTLDLRGVQFLSSAMLGKLVLLKKSASQQSVDLRLANVREEILEVLKITRLNNVFRFDDEDPDLWGACVPIPKPPSTLEGHAKPHPE